jgi:hypothetical protein
MADKTKKILFTATVKYDAVPPVTYEKGTTHTLRADLADRWVKRGVATDDPDAIAAATRKTEKKPADPPAPVVPPTVPVV